VGELVAEIAAASNEQAQGIDQVNKAVAEMDKVVQQNAANAEESASASEEMNAQAEQMKGMVNELIAMVGGGANGTGGGHYAAIKVQNVKTKGAIPSRAKMTRAREIATYKAREVRPDQLIPMDDAEFKDF